MGAHSPHVALRRAALRVTCEPATCLCAAGEEGSNDVSCPQHGGTTQKDERMPLVRARQALRLQKRCYGRGDLIEGCETAKNVPKEPRGREPGREPTTVSPGP